MFDVAVIGAGVVGGLVARELTRLGMKAVILEKQNDVAMGATRANSAIVHAGFDAKEGSLKALLNVRGSEMMEKLCKKLGVKYKRCGSIVVGFSEEDEETLEALRIRGEKNGVKGLRVISGDEARSLEKNLGESVTSALLAPSGAIVCPYELCMAAIGSAMDHGCELYLDFEVDKIELAGDVYRIFSRDREVAARFVINCAGAYSDDIAKMVGDDSFTVRARRGEYLLLDKELGGHVSRTVFRCPSKMGKGVLVTPTVDGNLLVGPSAEDIDDKSDTKTTAAAIASVKKKAEEQVSGINFGKVITTFAGLRATGSTGDFIINSPRKNFINAAGIESPGLSAAPAIAEYIADMLREMGAELSERSDFIEERRPMHYFRELSADEKNEIIKKHPEYAHVVCRCETVTEGEILEAIRTNPKPRDVDGVKRRTRATMGRCQGGFCTPYIVELLSRELAVDYEKITKCGGESFINVGRLKEGRLDG